MKLEDFLAAHQDLAAHPSKMLDAMDQADVCGGMLPTATAGADGKIVYDCSNVPSARKAAAELKEAQAIAAAHAPVPWLWIGAGAILLAALVYWVATD